MPNKDIPQKELTEQIEEVLQKYRNFWIDPQADIANTDETLSQLLDIVNQAVNKKVKELEGKK